MFLNYSTATLFKVRDQQLLAVQADQALHALFPWEEFFRYQGISPYLNLSQQIYPFPKALRQSNYFSYYPSWNHCDFLLCVHLLLNDLRFHSLHHPYLLLSDLHHGFHVYAPLNVLEKTQQHLHQPTRIKY